MQAGRLSIWRNAIENPQPLARALCVGIVILFIGLELWSAISAQLSTPAASRAHNTTSTQHAAANIEQITAADLFGHAANENGNLPQTDLQVTLRAVFASSDPKMTSAVIENSDGVTHIVKIGGAVGTSAKLQTVYPNRVVLLRNGALETLYFPTPQEVAANAMPSDTQNSANANPTSTSGDAIKRAAILQRLEELRANTPR